MDLSIRKQEQISIPPPSQPILNPTIPPNIPSNLSHNSIKQQYIPVPPIVQQRVTHPSKYVQLLNVIEEMGKDIKPSYAANKNSAERLRRAIASARILVRECQLECERNNRA